MGGLSGTSVAAQTVNATLTSAAAAGRCASDGSDIEWFLEWYSATGSTAVNATCAVTYNDNSTGNVVIALAATRPAYFLAQIQSAVAGKTIKSIETVTLSASTLTAGSFGVTAFKFLYTSTSVTANWPDKMDYAELGLPKVGTGACISGFVYATATSIGIIQGSIIIGAA
jgi:hypothetical protein